MDEKATEPQMALMHKLGINTNGEILTKKNVSKLIENKLSEGKKGEPAKATQAPKNGFNITPMYVSYAKDLCVAMLSHSNPDDEIATLMNQAISCIKAAKKEFEA